MTEASRSTVTKLRNAANKAVWGVRAAGLPAALRGGLRLANLRLRQPTQCTVRIRSGFTLHFTFPDQVPVALVAFGDLIDPEYSFLREIASPDWVVADVGAAIGQFTIFSATLPVGAVHSFEPSEQNLESLRKNIKLNSAAPRVIVHPLALSNYEGRQSFATSAHTWISGLDDSGAGPASTEVEVRRFDSELEALSISHLDVLKVNVAGDELRVLEGADEFLSRAGADVLVLLLGVDSFAHYARLATYGYRFFFFHPRKRELHEVLEFDSSLLARRPWPARHILGIHERAMVAGLAGQFPVHRPA